MAKFIEAVVRATGRKQRIPAHWLDHPTLGEPFKLTAQSRKRAEKAEALQTPAEESVDPGMGVVDEG